FIYPKPQNRIKITKQNNRQVTMLSKFGCELQDIIQACSIFQRSLRRTLNGRSISHRIAEWDAEFDDVCTHFGKFQNDRKGSLGIGVTCRDERNKTLPSRFFDFEKLFGNPAHIPP